MEEQLSLLDLVVEASFTVQAVMAVLVLASVVSWFVMVKRALYFQRAKAAMLEFEEVFGQVLIYRVSIKQALNGVLTVKLYKA